MTSKATALLVVVSSTMVMAQSGGFDFNVGTNGGFKGGPQSSRLALHGSDGRPPPPPGGDSSNLRLFGTDGRPPPPDGESNNPRLQGSDDGGGAGAEGCGSYGFGFGSGSGGNNNGRR
uniref:Uncharacterized protein n=1 Tax=Lygus hesperus TaxID=30085 RepID=A0A146LVC4_LYGHE